MGLLLLRLILLASIMLGIVVVIVQIDAECIVLLSQLFIAEYLVCSIQYAECIGIAAGFVRVVFQA
jgi:hypothetical protein